MLAILNSLNAHNFPIFQPILMILVSKFTVHWALSDIIYLFLGLLSPLNARTCIIIHGLYYFNGSLYDALAFHRCCCFVLGIYQ